MAAKKAQYVTYAQLTGLLEELGYEREVYDEHNVIYHHRPTRWMLFLANRPPDSPVRESDFLHVRSQLYWRGFMERDDFDAHFAGRTIARTR